jgi:hypothetical protein
MKSIIMPGNEQLNEETIEQLPADVKETLDNHASVRNKTKFTAVDLWNRQRNIRSASDRLRRWNLN